MLTLFELLFTSNKDIEYQGPSILSLTSYSNELLSQLTLRYLASFAMKMTPFF